MTQEQALELARAKWGEDAYAIYTPNSARFCFQVGCPTECAVGDSWREACENAGLLEPVNG